MNVKKFLSSVTALAMLSAFAVPVNAAEATLAGDLNNDSEVNIIDYVSMKQYLIGSAVLDEQGMANADINANGSINIFDAVSLAKQIVNGNTTVDPEEPVEPETPVTEEESTITLLGDSIETTSSTVVIDGTTATITVPGTYTITGTLNDGQIIVDVDKTTYAAGKVELSLEGVDITSSNNSPIYVASIDDECVITAKKGTDNIISDGTSYTNADEDSGAIYSKDDIKIKGKGNLIVNGNCADGIVSKNDIKIFNGNITVNAVDDGIRGKDSVKIGDADDIGTEGAFENLSVTVTTQSGDGIKSTNTEEEGNGVITVNGGTVNINAFSDGFHASKELNMVGGTVDVKTTATSSTASDASSKGLKAGTTDDAGTAITGIINVTGGTITVDSGDDCVHASGDISLAGGKLVLTSGDDACHTDANLTIGNGTADTLDDIVVYVSACYEGMEGLNITQNSGTVIINSTDDGYNAAGGADGSGSTSPGGWGQGGMTSGGGNYSLNLNGGFALVNIADGDHDGFDSNGSLTVSGGYFVTNGNEPFDCDGTKSYTGGVYVINKGSGGMGGMGGMGGSEMASTVTASCSANAGTRITLADGENVIVSFVAGKNVTSLTAGCNDFANAKFYTGGEVTGTAIADFNSQVCYVSGTLSGGTEASGSSSGESTMPW